MCGIAGYFGESQLDKTFAHRVLNKLAHRGPDAARALTYSTLNDSIQSSQSLNDLPESNNYLFHTRLAIQDLSSGADQPFVSSCGRYAMVFNGEIYNYIELRDELLKKGAVFRTTSDTEVLLMAYMHWGAACLNKLVGMFAFVILDRSKHELFIARDFFGIKPFFYSHNGGNFCFASEIKALLEFNTVSRRPNTELIYEYLAMGRQESKDKTFFNGIKRLPPAHYMVFDIKKSQVKALIKYWEIDNTTIDIPFGEAKERLSSLFVDSVSMHMRSDVPIAANLSGGIDSSAIVMSMNEILKGEKDINTISFIAEEEAINEEKWIDIVNKSARTVPHKVRPNATDLIHDMEGLIYTQEEPFGGSSAFAQYSVFKLIAKSGFKVTVDGQGADELLAGYRSYLTSRLASMLKQRKVFSILPFLYHTFRLPGYHRSMLADVYRSAKYLQNLSLSKRQPDPAAVGWAPDWMNLEYFQSRKISVLPNWQPKGKEILKAQLLYTFEEQSLPHLLKIADRNSMAFSVESRLPFLTPEIASFIHSLPEKYIISNDATTKYIFRKAMDSRVPREILARKDKIGFTTPEQKWLMDCQEWVDDVFSAKNLQNIPFLKSKNVLASWESFKRNGRGNTSELWRWLNLLKWSEQFELQY